ncbi:MAG: hypothetical protein NZ578_15540 [Candidatus Binatia bacterium]|nr:hypothetical protein [Candidatus Binatia bacterium]
MSLFLLSALIAGFMWLWDLVFVHSSPHSIALQFSPREVCPLVAQDATAKVAVLEGLQRDSSYLVPAYTVLLVSLGLAVFSGRSPAWIYGLGIVLFALLAAGSDLRENHYLESCLSGNYLAADPARRWAVLKWQFLSFALVAAAPTFLARRDWTQKIGYILAALGIPGFLLLIPLDVARPIVGYLLVPLLGLGLLLMAISFAADLTSPSTRIAHWH